jgi:hypothetical protein
LGREGSGIRMKTGYSRVLIAYRQSNTSRIDLGVVSATIPYILKDYCRTRSILGGTCKLSRKISGCGPVTEIDLTTTVEHMYGRYCLLLWLGWGGIRRRGRGGHDVQGEIRLSPKLSEIVHTGSHGPFNRLPSTA